MRTAHCLISHWIYERSGAAHEVLAHPRCRRRPGRGPGHGPGSRHRVGRSRGRTGPGDRPGGGQRPRHLGRCRRRCRQGRRLRRLPRHGWQCRRPAVPEARRPARAIHRPAVGPVQERRAPERDHARLRLHAQRPGHARCRRLLRQPEGDPGRGRRQPGGRRPQCRPQVLRDRPVAVALGRCRPRHPGLPGLPRPDRHRRPGHLPGHRRPARAVHRHAAAGLPQRPGLGPGQQCQCGDGRRRRQPHRRRDPGPGQLRRGPAPRGRRRRRRGPGHGGVRAMQRLLLTALLALALAACGQEPAATPAPPAAEAAAPAPAPASEAAAEPANAEAADPGAASTDPADADADAAGSADDAAAPADAGEADEAAASDAASGPAATTAAADVPLPGGPPPREGVDFEILPLPQPTYGSGDGIEVAEVFSYTCIHCANLQPYLNAWHERLPADVRFVYVPAAFGGVVDNFARAYFASEAMGLLEKTHDALFSAVLVERRIRTGSEEELADWYAAQGADRDVFLSTMRSSAVTGKLNRARQFALNTGVRSTPTIIVAGKYRAVATREGGMEGLLNTVDWLVARERGTALDF